MTIPKCVKCGERLTGNKLTYVSRDVDQWNYEVAHLGKGRYGITRNRRPTFVTVDTECYWVECACGETYDIEEEGWREDKGITFSLRGMREEETL